MTALLLLALAGCGVERVDVKNLQDRGARLVLTRPVVRADVEDLRALVFPSDAVRWNGLLERIGPETQRFEIEARIIGAKLEDDGDLHVVIAGDSGETMIVELPDPGCVVGSPAAAQLGQARAKMEVILRRQQTRTFRRLATPVRVRIVGVLFFDKLHGQTGVAPNGVELHPVTSIEVMAPEATP